MPAPVLFTVDTELTWRGHLNGLSWQGNYARSIEPAGVGLSFQLNLLKRHGLKGCFFIDPLPALIFGLDPIRRMVETVLQADQEVQLHLHAQWADLASGREALRYELTQFDAGEQKALISTARDLLVEAGAPMPTAFRAGSFAADLHTLEALAAMGFRYDSSFNATYADGYCKVPLGREIAPRSIAGLVELPVSQVRQGSDALKHLQICAVSFWELAGALRHAERHGHPLVNIVSHGFELATVGGLRANRLRVRRFEKLCRLLAERRDAHPTVFTSELDGIDLGAQIEPMRTGRVRERHRRAEQVWSGLRYERPGETVTALGGTGLIGLEFLLPLIGE